jgi:hypothetical protein
VGTFKLSFQSGSISLGGGTWFYNGPSDPVAALAVANDGNDTYVLSLAYGGADGTYTLRGNMDSSNIRLDGGAPISYSGLPAGFTVTSAQGHIKISCGVPAAIPNTISGQWFYQNFAIGASWIIPNGTNYYSVGFPLDVNGDPPTMSQLLGIGFGFNFILTCGPTELASVGMDLLEIIGTYSVPTSHWYQDSGTGVKSFTDTPGVNDVLIPTPIYLNPIPGEFLVDPPVIPGSPWIPWVPTGPIAYIGTPILTPTIITPIFLPDLPPVDYIPVPLPDPIIFTPTLPIVIEEEPDPEEFPRISGPIPTDNGYTINIGGAATFVFIGSPSGIYTLIPGQTHDTLYDRTGQISIDVKIPNPFIETGYLGQ